MFSWLDCRSQTSVRRRVIVRLLQCRQLLQLQPIAASVTAAGSGADSTSGPLTSAAAAPPFRLLGPLALPFRISSSGAPGAGGSLGEAIGGERILSRSAGLSGLEPLGLPAAGGPRASMLARPGLKRLASLLVSFAAGGGETTRFFVYSSLRLCPLKDGGWCRQIGGCSNSNLLDHIGNPEIYLPLGINKKPS